MLMDRLEMAGCKIDWAGKTDWQSAGDFHAAIQLTETLEDSNESAAGSNDDQEHQIVIKSQLSESAVHLLSAAVKSIDGWIDVIQLDHGFMIEANGINFCDTGNPVSEAAAKSVLMELVEHGLVEDQSGYGAQFVVTEKGFRNIT